MATQQPTLSAEARSESGKGVARRLRREGKLPGVVYGRNTDSVALAIDPDDLDDVFDNPLGHNTVFKLDLGDDEYEHVILRDYQVHPVRRDVLHVDLMVVEPDQEIELEVPVEPVGHAAGVEMGGTLRIIRPEVRVKCTPATIPDTLKMDVTDLVPGGALLASEIDYPEGVEPVFKVDYGVARILMPREEVIGLEPEGAEEAEGEEVEGEEVEGEEVEGEEVEGEEGIE